METGQGRKDLGIILENQDNNQLCDVSAKPWSVESQGLMGHSLGVEQSWLFNSLSDVLILGLLKQGT